MQKIKKINLLLFILLGVFLLSRSYLNILSELYGIVALGAGAYLFFTQNSRAEMSLDDFFCILGLVGSVIIIVFFSKYTISNTLQSALFLLVAFLEFQNTEEWLSDSQRENVFYWLVNIGLFINWIIGANVSISTSSSFVLPSAWDKNYTGVVLYLYFCYCLKRGFYVGKIVAVLYIFTLQSRLYILAFFMTCALELFRILLKKFDFLDKMRYEMNDAGSWKVFLLIIGSTIAMIIISYIWMVSISFAKVSGYQQSINDKSNAIRTRSNIYALNLILENPELLIYGYDNDIRFVLGVEDENNARQYSGYRLVQPHNLVLNLFLKNGVFFSVFYLLLLSKLISLYWREDNLPIIIPYLVMNMVMHSLLTTTYLICFLYIIAIPRAKGNISISIKRDYYL